MAQPDVFLPFIRSRINGPLDMMMRNAVINASVQFCRESLYCREYVEIGNVEKGQTVELTTPDQPVKCVRLLNITFADEPLPYHDYYLMNSNTLCFRRKLLAVNAVIAVEPRISAAVVPDALADDYAEAVAFGALQELYMMPGKPWTDPQRSEYYRLRFTDGFRDAYRKALESHPSHTGFNNPVRRHSFC
ncbi:hypothetical protein PMPD1_2467 [Paramixta manurensis]|uniref:Uncharacterized protein n=1 Tax=Paramixta manurensis TaxID=2740817 RepID=A0A6M8UCF0_9GAMM|nr:hypothetical protein PMPD1_2467 [Erwiniaceae bacterium PD-1]